MKKASITEAKNRLSALIDGLRGGTSVLIVDRGRPVARLEPVNGGQQPDGALDRLIRGGIVRPGRSPFSAALFKDELPHPENSGSAVNALIKERREGR